MDIESARGQPSDDASEEPWRKPSWFDEPWLGADWTNEPWPPAWAPAARVAPALLARRQVVLEEIGRAILQLRLARAWSQREVEIRSGVDQTTISRLERGQQRGLSIRALVAVLEALRTGRIQFLPPRPLIPTTFDIVMDGDLWNRAGDLALRRLARSRKRRSAS